MSRDKILAALEAQSLPDIPLPEGTFPGQEFDDPLAHFKEILTSVGGTSEVVVGRAAVKEIINSVYPDRGRTVTTIPDLDIGAELVSADDDPHSYKDVSLAVLPGRFAVAENAAIWLDESDMGQRSLPFITEHLVIVVEKTEILSNMHQAYSRFNSTEIPGFGAFISGPSKTADIEQCLVVGAHGSRSLLVVFCESSGWRAQVGNIKSHFTRIKTRG